MDTSTLYEQIEEFLAGRIPRESLEQTARELGISDLDSEIQFVRDTQVAVEAQGLKEELQKILPAPARQSPRVVRLRVRTWPWAAAASVLLLVAAGIWLFQPGGANDLYAQYEYRDPGLPVLMSQSDQFELYEALSYFGEEDYAESARRLSDLQASLTDNDTVNYFLGASQLYLGETANADTNLEQVAEDDNSSFRQKAEWLLVLSALREQDEAKARERLQDILNRENHSFRERAQALNNDLQE